MAPTVKPGDWIAATHSSIQWFRHETIIGLHKIEPVSGAGPRP
jgi:hypothetical protein